MYGIQEVVGSTPIGSTIQPTVGEPTRLRPNIPAAVAPATRRILAKSECRLEFKAITIRIDLRPLALVSRGSREPSMS